MNMIEPLALSVAVALSAMTSVAAASHGPNAPGTPAQSPADPTLADGEIRKIDKDAGKLTIRHGEIKNLQMPGMTMVFRIHDAAVLDQLQPGDKVRFSAERLSGGITVTHVEKAP